MNENCCLEFRPTIWHRLGFGNAHVPPPEDDDANSMITESTIFLDWKDRLRVLLSGRLSHFVRTQTDVQVKSAQSISTVKVLPPKWGAP